MLTILADALMTATRQERGRRHHDHHQDWAGRFVPEHKRRTKDPYRFNLYRDLW